MNSLQFVGNFTVISVFKLIFIQQNYRTVNFYSENSENAVFNEIIQIASDSLKPFTHMNLDKIRLERSSFDEPILNVLFVNDLIDAKKKLIESKSLHGTTVIWSESDDDFNNTPISWLKISSKVIVLTHSNLCALNNFVETQFNQISLTNFSLASTSHFLAKFFSISSINGSSLTIFTEFDSPKSDLTSIGNNSHFIGPDGIIAESLVKLLNIKPKFSSSARTKIPNYENWLNNSFFLLRLRYQNYHSAVLTKNVVTIFDYNLSSAFDVQLASIPQQGRNFSMRVNVSTEALFPHETSCLVAIVPQRSFSNHFPQKVMKNAYTIAICLVLLLFIVWRLCLQKKSWLCWHRVFGISFNTIAVFLNQNKMKNDRRMEIVWEISLRTFSLLVTTTLSGIVFKSLISVDSNEINTVDDLIKSDLTIYAPNYLKKNEISHYLRPALRSKFIFSAWDHLQSLLMEEPKFDFACILPDTMANFFTMVVNAKVPVDSRLGIHVMQEKIHCVHASYRMPEDSPLTPYVHLFILRFMENGIYEKQLEWMQKLNEAVFGVKQAQSPESHNVVLNMQMTVGVFNFYLIGIGAAILCLVIEVGYNYALHFISSTNCRKGIVRKIKNKI